MVSRLALGGNLLSPLLPLPLEIGAVLAQRLIASAGAVVLRLDIVAGIAVRIVVMDIGFDRVPRRFVRHDRLPFLEQPSVPPIRNRESSQSY